MDFLRNLSTRQRLAGAAVLAVAVAFLMISRRRGVASEPAAAATEPGISDPLTGGQPGFYSPLDAFPPVAGAASAGAQPDPLAAIDSVTATAGALGSLLDALTALQGGVSGSAGEAPAASPPQTAIPAAAVPPAPTPAAPAAPSGVLRGEACKAHNASLGILNFDRWEAWHLATTGADAFRRLTRAQRAAQWRAYVTGRGGCIP